MGGKRAAIQFAFDLKAGNYDVPNHASDYDLGTEHFNAVELLRKVKNIIDSELRRSREFNCLLFFFVQIDELTAASAKSWEQVWLLTIFLGSLFHHQLCR